jgi:hypothetical protein
MTKIWRFLGKVHSIAVTVWRVAMATAGPGLIAVAALALAFVPQFQDLLRFMVEDGLDSFAQILWLHVSALLLSLAVWYSARVLTYQVIPEMLAGSERRDTTGQVIFEPPKPYETWLVNWHPRLLGASPWGALALAALRSPERSPRWLGLSALAGAALCLLFQRYRLEIIGKSPARKSRLRALAGRKRQEKWAAAGLGEPELSAAKWVICGALAVSAVLFVTITATKGRAPALWMGAIPTLFFSLSILAFFSSGVTYVSIRFQLPVGLAVVAWVALLSALSCNDNHAVRESGGVFTGRTPEIGEAFTNWLANRADLGIYSNGYPVFMVSTEGGGIRAAYHTAMVLGALQDRNPRFAQHLFCASGVSGGSVGAALFAALCQDFATNAPASATSTNWGPGTNTFRCRLDGMLRDDWVAPAMAMMLFSDLVQKFLPYPFACLDRAPALELAMEWSWKNAIGTRALTNSFRSMANGFETNAYPALFLNTTHVESGQRVVVTPFTCAPTNHGFLTLDHVTNFDLRVSTAAFLSARFPLISPPALLWTPASNPVPVHLVDGGFFENSGCATLLDIYHAINPDTNRSKPLWTNLPPPRFLILRIDTVNESDFLPTNRPAALSPSMVIPPLTALFNTRDARGSGAAFDADRLIETNLLAYYLDTRPKSDREMAEAHINRAPLGWTLSQISRNNINRAYGLGAVTSNPAASTNRLLLHALGALDPDK